MLICPNKREEEGRGVNFGCWRGRWRAAKVREVREEGYLRSLEGLLWTCGKDSWRPLIAKETKEETGLLALEKVNAEGETNQERMRASHLWR